MRAIVLLADLKASRKKEGRDALGRQIRESIQEINEQSQDYLVTPFGIQRGIDEFGGIIQPAAPTGHILVDFWKALHPHEVRFSLSKGELDVVPEENPSVHEFDGPAFHSASEALSKMDKAGKLVSLEIESQEPAPQLEDTANLLYFQILDWTPHQLEVYEAYAEKESQAEVAELFGISQPTVSETLQKVRTKFMRTALDRMADQLRQRFGGTS